MNMVHLAITNTERFLSTTSRAKQKSYGQFFTSESVARYMAQMLQVDTSCPELHLLDPGAGTGVLGIALVEHLRTEIGYRGEIHLTCYETDPLVTPVLMDNLTRLREAYNIHYTVIVDNYLLSQSFEEERIFAEKSPKYDLVISNPPYKKLPKTALEAQAMRNVCYGSPNLYALFCAMSIYNLREGGELVYLIPRSWTSGAYFQRFRSYLHHYSVITDIHTFERRDSVFGSQDVLQEVMILKLRKTTLRPSHITITSSDSSDMKNVKSFKAPYTSVVDHNEYVFLVQDESDAKLLSLLNALPNTLPSLHLKMRTGLVVDFRAREEIARGGEESGYPLFCPSHIRNGKVQWPLGFEGERIATDKLGLLQKNSDYLFVKRFTSKEEKRRLQCGLYLREEHPIHQYISTQNKLNFIQCDSPTIAYGLYALLSSTLYDRYYRILNGSTQVNSTEVNTMPMPDRNTIELIGRELMNQEPTEDKCNDIITKWII